MRVGYSPKYIYYEFLIQGSCNIVHGKKELVDVIPNSKIED